MAEAGCPAHSFLEAWFSPTGAARAAMAALGEGFCPYGCGALDETRTCPCCGVTWGLTGTGFSGSVPRPDDSSTTLTVYPLAPWRQPVIDLGAWGG